MGSLSIGCIAQIFMIISTLITHKLNFISFESKDQKRKRDGRSFCAVGWVAVKKVTCKSFIIAFYKRKTIFVIKVIIVLNFCQFLLVEYELKVFPLTESTESFYFSIIN